MFDVFRSRDKAVRTVLTVMLGLVALSMVAYLVPGGPGGGSNTNEQVIAQVCDSKITLREVQLQLQSALKNKAFPMQMIQNKASHRIQRIGNILMMGLSGMVVFSRVKCMMRLKIHSLSIGHHQCIMIIDGNP